MKVRCVVRGLDAVAGEVDVEQARFLTIHLAAQDEGRIEVVTLLVVRVAKSPFVSRTGAVPSSKDSQHIPMLTAKAFNASARLIR